MPTCPTSARRRFSRFRQNSARAPWVKYGPVDGSFGCGSQILATVTPRESNPGFTCCSAQKLRTSSAPPTSSTTAIANSATMSTRRARVRSREPLVRPPPTSAVCIALRAACTAGARPNSSPVSSDAPALKSTTVQLSPTSVRRGSVDGASCSTRSSSHSVSSHPRAPPASASSRLSTSCSRTMRAGLAPRARRTATSRSRAAARASCRFAMFAQPMSSTSTTAAITMRSDDRADAIRSCFSASTVGTHPMRAG